jgi:8-oxo-(d)GTP phosphatase
MPPLPEVVAAGAVVVRKGPRHREVLLVHRPKYDDWSFPKGKQEPDEHVTATAVREVLEETGVEIRLDRPLPDQRYAIAGDRRKRVHYWVGRVLGDDDVAAYPANDEVDDLGWFSLDKAAARLTHPNDLALLDEVGRWPRRTTPLLVVRHGKARARKQWKQDDALRPLTAEGKLQAQALVPVLHAYGVTHVLTSTSTRCRQSVEPYVREQVLHVVELPALSEEQYTAPGLETLVNDLLQDREPTAVCTHRPVLPELLVRLGVDVPPLKPGEVAVLHHRNGRVRAVERHLPR